MPSACGAVVSGCFGTGLQPAIALLPLSDDTASRHRGKHSSALTLMAAYAGVPTTAPPLGPDTLDCGVSIPFDGLLRVQWTLPRVPVVV
jgi:hypothetical protein